MTVITASHPSPLGDLLLISEDDVLRALYLPEHRGSPHDGSPDATSTAESPVLRAAAAQLDAYFAGELREFDLPLAPAGTRFQRQVWDELGRIPFGETISYKELATRLGDPRKVRAVGLANGRNPHSIVVPCHRVIGADGSLVGYGGGLERKQWLLEHEAVAVGRRLAVG